KVSGPDDLGGKLGLERSRRRGVQPARLQAPRALPSDASMGLLDPRTVELHGEHSARPERDVDVAGLAELADESRIERPAGEAQSEKRPGTIRLGLRREDPSGGAGGLGARNAAFEHGASDAGLLQSPGEGAADDARPDDQHFHQR